MDYRPPSCLISLIIIIHVNINIHKEQQWTLLGSIISCVRIVDRYVEVRNSLEPTDLEVRGWGEKVLETSLSLYLPFTGLNRACEAGIPPWLIGIRRGSPGARLTGNPRTPRVVLSRSLCFHARCRAHEWRESSRPNFCPFDIIVALMLAKVPFKNRDTSRSMTRAITFLHATSKMVFSLSSFNLFDGYYLHAWWLTVFF